MNMFAAKVVYSDYTTELEHQAAMWRKKPQLRMLYARWYARMLTRLSDLKPVLEIGAGCGNLKEFYPELIATDVVSSGPWIDLILDAQDLTVAPSSIGNLLAFDVVHHLQRPLRFLRQAAKALKPGGRLIMCEPAATPWSRFLYGLVHHETIDLKWDLFGLDGKPPAPDPGHTFANMAIPELLFWKYRAETLRCVPELKLTNAEKTGFIMYPLTGGFNYPCLVPATGFRMLLNIEDIALRPFASWLTGMRMLVVLEKV